MITSFFKKYLTFNTFCILFLSILFAGLMFNLGRLDIINNPGMWFYAKAIEDLTTKEVIYGFPVLFFCIFYLIQSEYDKYKKVKK